MNERVQVKDDETHCSCNEPVIVSNLIDQSIATTYIEQLRDYAASLYQQSDEMMDHLSKFKKIYLASK